MDGRGFRGIQMNPLRHAFVADDTAVDPVMEMARRLAAIMFRHLPKSLYCTPLFSLSAIPIMNL